MRATANEDLADLLSQQFEINLSKDKLVKICELMKERATFIQDILTEGEFLIQAPTDYDEQTVHKKWKADSAKQMQAWMEILENIETFNHESIESAFKSFLEEKELGIGAVLPNFRLLVTGKGMGPSMFEIASFLGKEECLKRMNQGLKNLQEVNS